MKKLFFLQDSGQALISILFITIIGMTVISSAAVIIYGNIQSASITEQGIYAYFVAESGAEEGLLRLIRNPSYTGTPANQPLLVGLGSAIIQADSSSGTITSTGTYNNSVRKIQVKTVYNNGVLTVTFWKEVY